MPVLVRLSPDADRGLLRRRLAEWDARLAREYQLLPDVVAVRDLPAAELDTLALVPGVVEVLEDRKVRAFLPEGTPLISADPAALGAAGVPVTGAGVVVCVVDTGIDKAHACFPPGVLVAEKDFVNNDADAQDDDGHGTFVSGIVACRDPQNPGVAPEIDAFVRDDAGELIISFGAELSLPGLVGGPSGDLVPRGSRSPTRT